MKVLVAGADGMIGSALARHLKKTGKQFVETTRQREKVRSGRIWLDLADSISINSLPKVDVCVLCAALTNIEACAENPAYSHQINVEGALAVAQHMTKIGAHTIFLSTNQIFDGSTVCQKATDSRSPITEYGRQKAEAEKQLVAMGHAVSILRLSKVLEAEPPLFISWRDDLNLDRIIRPYSNMTLAPIDLEFVVNLIDQLLHVRAGGIFQASGDEDVAYIEAAAYLLKFMTLDANKSCPQSKPSGIENSAPPKYTSLDSSRIRKEFGLIIPSSRKVLTTIMSNLAVT
jgi:dTDP-4-dehydrorhamnose reductase